MLITKATSGHFGFHHPKNFRRDLLLTDGGPWRTMAECDYRKCEAQTKILKSETKVHETSHAVVYKTSVSHFMIKITPPKDTDGKGKFISLFLYVLYSQTSLILTPKGQSKVSVLERCPYKKGHYDDVTYSFKSVQPELKSGSHSSLNCI